MLQILSLQYERNHEGIVLCCTVFRILTKLNSKIFRRFCKLNGHRKMVRKKQLTERVVKILTNKREMLDECFSHWRSMKILVLKVHI